MRLERVLAKAIKKRGDLSDFDDEWVDADAEAYVKAIEEHFVVIPRGVKLC